MSDRFFPYRFDDRWKPLFTLLRVGRDDGVTITADRRLVITYGWARIDTTVDNVDHIDITGPHRWYTAVGLRLSLADDGITFGTDHRRGVCIGFVEKVPRVIGCRDHSAVWVSVDDPEGLAAALTVA